VPTRPSNTANPRGARLDLSGCEESQLSDCGEPGPSRLQPGSVSGVLSDMEGEMALQREDANARLGERAAMAAEFPLFLEQWRSHPK
jgi:hypothetical protein